MRAIGVIGVAGVVVTAILAITGDGADYGPE
jgi:hypothetical protein